MQFKKTILTWTETSRDEEENSSCICGGLREFHKSLTKQFYKLGIIVATSPSYFIIFPIFFTLLFVTGFQNMKYENDPEFLFSPSNSTGSKERQVIESHFPVNYTQAFDPSRVTKITAFARFIIIAKDKETMLRTQIFEELLKLDSIIKNISIDWQDKIYFYEDVCAIWNSQCHENEILKLNDFMADIENKTMFINYPIMVFPAILPFFYGGAKVNESEGYVQSIQAITLHYWLKENNWRAKERSHIWEKKVLEVIEKSYFESIEVVPYISLSLEDELQKNTDMILLYLPPTVMIMATLSILSLIMSDWVRSKIAVSVMGLLTAGLAIACSFGFLMYMGVPFIGINLAAPFLLLGIGIDDMFVVLSAWRRTEILDEVPIRLANTYSEAAVSITITSLTNILSFFIGAITPFPSVYIFCIYTGVSLIITYVFFITFFGACLALAGYEEKKQRHNITCRTVKSKSESEDAGCCYKLWCTGGINPQDPWNPKDNEPHLLMVWFKEYFAHALNMKIVKALIICLFVIYLAGAIYGCMQVKEGLEKQDLALDESYLTTYYHLEDSLFREFPYRIQVVINDNITYSDPETQRQLLDLHSTFEDLSYIGSSIYTESWFRGFYKFLSKRPKLRRRINNEKSFITVLKRFYLIPETAEHLDVIFNEDETRILASRFIIQSINVSDTNADKSMMQQVRKVAEEAPFNVVTYHPLFVFFDQFVLVVPSTIQTILLVAIVMMVVSLVFIPNPFCSLWVIFSIVSIEIGVIGYMALWGVRLDCISMINLIMCIGFSVDFSAHISYSYLTATAETPDDKVKECMFNLGLPVLQSGISTIAGVLLFIVAPSNIFRTFFKIICLVILFGIMHAILLLPVMLSLVGPEICKKKSRRNSIANMMTKISRKFSNGNDSTSFEIKRTVPELHSKEEMSSQSSESVYSEGSVSNQSSNDDNDTASLRSSSRGRDSDSGIGKGMANEAFVIHEEENVECIEQDLGT